MPDLTRKTFAMCSSNILWERPVRGKTDNYTVRFERVNEAVRLVAYDYTCTCKHFEIRCQYTPGKYCKHIDDVRHERCGWDEMTFGGSVIDERLCPICLSEVEFREEAV